MKQNEIIKCGGQNIPVYSCDPEKNTECDKRFCMHNINAIDKKNMLWKLDRKRKKKRIPPVEKNSVLILSLETGGWPRQRRENSHMIKK